MIIIKFLLKEKTDWLSYQFKIRIEEEKYIIAQQSFLK